MSEAVDSTEGSNEEASFVIFAEGPDGMTQMDQTDENQQLSIGDDGITIVVTPENEQQVSELLRALQASQGGEDVQILTESGEEIPQFSKIKTEANTDETEVVEPPKRKRGRPPKNQQTPTTSAQQPSPAETANKKAKLIELALQEADASVAEGVSSLKSSRLRERAAKQGGLKKLWANKDDLEEEEQQPDIVDRGELKSDGENENHTCEECPEV